MFTQKAIFKLCLLAICASPTAQLFALHSISCKISNKILQIQQISGTIIDENSQPLIGASVIEAGTSNGTVTDLNGQFSISIKEGSKIKITFIGYEELIIDTPTTGMKITLNSISSQLDQVIVIGYGKQDVKDLTGSVSQIRSVDFKKGLSTSAENLIQGKIAGVRISTPSGEPGAGINVIIRGLGSIRSGSTPLFVVDGVPLPNDDVTPSGGSVGYGSSASKNPLNFLNPDDIESINVLKDASSAAIYGTRGSNGVVLITTKKGAINDGTITVSTNESVSALSHKIKVLSGDEYRGLVGETSSYNHGSSTDWQDEIFRKAISNNTQLSYSKRNETGGFYASAGRMDQKGIIENSEFKRLSARLNADQSFFRNRLSLKMNLTVSQMDENGVPTSSDAGSNGQLITQVLMANPTQSVYDSTGNYNFFNLDACYNPKYMLYIYEDETSTLRGLGNIEASLKLFKNVTYKLNYSYDRSTSERNTTIYQNETEINPDGLYIQKNLDNKSELIEHYLTYELEKLKHKFDLLGGFSYQNFLNESTTYTVNAVGAKGGIKPKYNPSYYSDDISATGSAQKNEIQSFFARTNYSYDSKYMLTASLRADGSTRFGENMQYGYFPSFALGWNISQENFLNGSDFINKLKLRASWGKTGNQEVENKITKGSYSLSASNGYYLTEDNFTNGISIVRTPNKNLHWEVVSQLNFGLDFSLLNNRFRGTFEYYNKETTAAILYVTAKTLSPTEKYWKNIDGKIINKGFEFNLGYDILRKKNLKWSLDFNGATLANKVKNLPETLYSGGVSGPGLTGVTVNIYKSNYEIGSFYLYKHAGWNADGSELLEDTNNDGSISADDKVIVEGALPNFNFGINSNLSYKNLDLNLSFIGQTGGMIFNNTALTALNYSNLKSDRNIGSRFKDSGAGSGYTPVASTYYLEKSDFFRLNSARLSYRFNTQKLNLEWLKGLELNVTGQNLFTLTKYQGYDPMANTDKASDGNQSVGVDYTVYPSARTISCGLTLNL
jgi:TonB-dependent starch-binding outer membrane protein SusC